MISGRTFYALLKNIAEKSIHILKHMIIGKTVDKARKIVPTNVSLVESKPDKVTAMHVKPSVERDTQMLRHRVVPQHDDEKLRDNWKEEIQVWDEYACYGEQFLDMLTKISDHLRQTLRASKHRKTLH